MWSLTKLHRLKLDPNHKYMEIIRTKYQNCNLKVSFLKPEWKEGGGVWEYRSDDLENGSGWGSGV